MGAGKDGECDRCQRQISLLCQRQISLLLDPYVGLVGAGLCEAGCKMAAGHRRLKIRGWRQSLQGPLVLVGVRGWQRGYRFSVC